MGRGRGKIRVFRLSSIDLQLTELEALPIKPAMADPAGRRRGVFAWSQITSQSIFAQGGVPEWLKGTGCKPVGYAYVGSNPTPSTNHSIDMSGMVRV